MQTGLEPRYIRITDFGEHGIPADHEYTTPDVVELECELFANDILFARSGATVGKTYLHEDDSHPAIFAGYCIRFRFDPRKALPKFVWLFTKTAAFARWIIVTQRPSGQPNINKEEFKSAEIPLPPPLVQQELVATMEEARAERRVKLAEAGALLASFDSDLLKTLGLSAPPEEKRRVYAHPLRTVLDSSRLDADYFHPERVLSIRAMERVTERLWCPRLEEAVSFEREQIKQPGSNYIGLANIQPHTGELTPGDEDVAGSCSVFRADDVLFARLRPYLNKVYRAERGGCCSPEFHVLRIRAGVTLLPEYLATVLRSSIILAQTRHMMTGNTHPRLTNEDVTQLFIPVPDPETQVKLVAELHRRREAARRLRVEAEAVWQAAKRWFEEQLVERADRMNTTTELV
jgi:type I restriction enzyme S subunit